MKLIQKTAPIDNGDIITDKLLYNVRMAAYDAGMLGKMRMFALGDSMTGYGMASGYAAFLAQMRMYGYDADIAYNHGSYYDNQPSINDPNLGGVAWPAGPRGWNFAAGGKNVKHMNDVQMPFVREAFNAGTLPMHFLISPGQNNQYWQTDAVPPEQVCLDIIKVVDELIDKMGRRGILLGPWPHSRLAADATGKHYVEQRMREYAATKPGLIYVSILDALKSGVPSEEAADNVNYKGWQLTAGQVGRASWDEIHAAPYGAHIVGNLLAHAFRIMCSEYRGRVFEASAYDKTKNPLGNFFGPMGRLAGTGGTIVNVANPTPANWTRTATNNLPAGFELIYDQSKGVTLTPTLTGNPDYPLRITASGTPTADLLWALRMAVQADMTDGHVELYGKARWVAQNGWGGIGFGNAGQGSPGVPSDMIITPIAGHGGGGGADYVMPFEMNDNITFHGPASYYNFGNRRVPLDVSGGFAKDIPVSGALEVGRLGMFKTILPANY